MTVTADTATDPTGRLQTRAGIDFAVADLALAEFGRKEIRLAEHEMPGLMELRRSTPRPGRRPGPASPGSLHMTVQTAVLIETLVSLGADVRWASCNIFSTQDHGRRGGIGPHGTVEEPKGVPVFAWKGETLEEYWWATEQMLTWPEAGSGDPARGPNMILDDGGDATLLVHKGVEFEANGVVPTVDDDDLDQRRADHPGHAARLAGRRQTALDPDRRRDPRRHRGDHHRRALALPAGRAGPAAVPAINVNDSVTKSKFDNVYGIRHSMIDGLNRATDVLIGGKVALVCGFGDVRGRRGRAGRSASG